MAKHSISYDEHLIESLRNDEEAQIAFVQASVEENSDMPKAILSALRLVAEARGFKSFSEEVQLNRQSLYKALDVDGNPTLESMIKMLDVLGLRLSVAPKSKVS